MSLRAYQRLINDLCVRVPMLEAPFAELLFGEAAGEFARMSTIWREVIEERTDGVGLCLGVVPSSGMIQQVAAITDPDQRPYKGWWYLDGTIRFNRPFPEADLLIELVLVPEPGGEARELPDDFVRLHYDSLLEGTLAYIYEQPARPFSSLKHHLEHRRRFTLCCGRARHQALTHGNPHRAQIKIPYFGVDRQGYHG